MSVYNFFSYIIFLIFFFAGSMCLMLSAGVNIPTFTSVISSYFLFDTLSFYLVVLVFFLGIFTLSCLGLNLSLETKGFLLMSLIFSGACFCVNHAVLFWCFYELAMLPLLYLIFKDSPYSERFLAGWYFAVYLLITSLPLILVLLYLSSVNGTLHMSSWNAGNSWFFLCVVLSFIFFTKVPLGPFHTWLPIVHAEATSVVSIFLSGYIMKLGLLGVYRCTPFLFGTDFFMYLFFCCVLSIFFMVEASTELDGKRWLAFLSLSHIVVAFLAFYVCGWESISLGFLFCLGHGLSAGLVFGMLWLQYDVTNSRNWLLLKEGVNGKGPMFVMIVALLSLCSFPPTLQFFCEANLLIESIFSCVFILFWVFYLFFGGLVPLVLCGYTMVRTQAVENNSFMSVSFYFYFFYLAMWCYIGIFVL
uniref:NADH-ubiquinone oxidoreductase chain 4 n=1 Tax=Echeneibothrium multiloculatum TaxID=1975669 RepID=A0A8K1SY25_9CEST|nr:NADH dehydrogenase subunit 4 [Echeneibothrium multiloculatum]